MSWHCLPSFRRSDALFALRSSTRHNSEGVVLLQRRTARIDVPRCNAYARATSSSKRRVQALRDFSRVEQSCGRSLDVSWCHERAGRHQALRNSSPHHLKKLASSASSSSTQLLLSCARSVHRPNAEDAAKRPRAWRSSTRDRTSRPGRSAVVAMGPKVTLRGQQMYAFLTTFVELVRSRMRKFPALVIPDRPEHEHDKWRRQLRVWGRRARVVPPRARSTRTCTQRCPGFTSVLSPRPEGSPRKVVREPYVWIPDTVFSKVMGARYGSECWSAGANQHFMRFISVLSITAYIILQKRP